MSNITVTFAQYQTDTAGGPFNAGDMVTLADTSTVLDGLTDTQIDGLTTNNVDVISATDGVLSWDADQFSHFINGTVTIDPDTFAVLADTGADIDALTATQIGEIAAKGVAAINPTDGVLSFTVAQFNALGAMSVDASATFTIADTGAALAAMSAGRIASLGSLGVDILDSTTNALSLTVAQYQALGPVALTAADVVTLADNGANLNALTTTDYSHLHSNGIDIIDATDNAFSLSLAEFNALNGVTLTLADTVTLADTGAAIGALTTTQIHALATAGIDAFDATDNALSLSIAQYNQTVTDAIALTATDTVTLADSGTNLAALTPTQIDALVNIDVFNATDTNLTLSAAQFTHLLSDSIALTAANNVTISDTATALGALTFSALQGENVDFLNATTAFTTLTVAQLTALGTVAFTAASSVTLTDSGTNIAAVSNFATFAAHGVDTLDASNNAMTISATQFGALGTTQLTGSDVITVSDTAANISALNYSALAAAGVDLLNATTAITVAVSDITNLGAVDFTAASTVTLVDSGSNIAAVADFTIFAAHGVDTIDANNNVLTINTTQFGGLGAVTLTAGDTVTISDTAANLAGLTFSALAGANVDFLNSTTAFTTLTVAQLTALGVVAFTAASDVTLTDSAVNIQAVSDFTTFAAHGVDTIDSSDNTLSLSVAQFSGLGTTHLTGADVVTLADTAAALQTYLDTAGTSAALLANGVDTIHATGGSLTVDAAAVTAVSSGGAVFASGDTVTLSDTGTQIAALDFTTLPTLHVDTIDASDNTLGITLAQYLDVAGVVAFTAADAVTVSGSASAAEALSPGQIGALQTNHIDALAVTSGGDLDWNVAQWQSLGAAVSVSDTSGALVVDDSETNIEALNAAQLGALATQGVQELLTTDGTLVLSVSQAEGLLGTGLVAAPGLATTLSDSAANIAALTPTQFGQLLAANFDAITATGTLDLSVAQFQAVETALHAATLTLTNPATLADTGAAIDALTVTEIGQLHSDNITAVSATSGDIDWTQAQYSALGATTVTAAGTLVLADSEANIEALSTAAIDSDHTIGVTEIHSTSVSDQLNFTVAQTQHIIADSMSADNSTVTVTDTGAHISTLTASQLAALNSAGFNQIDVTSGNIVFTVAQLNGDGVDTIKATGGHFILDDTEANIEGNAASDFTRFFIQGVDQVESSNSDSLLLSAQDAILFETHSATILFGDGVVSDNSTNIDALTAAQITALAAAGFGRIDATDNLVTFSAAQYNALGTVALTTGDTVTLSDTGAALAALNFASFAGNGVDKLDATDNVLTLSVAKFNQLGAVALTAADTVTIADTAAHINTLAFGSLAGKNIDVLDVSGPFSLNVTRYLNMGAVKFAAADTITLSDSSTNIQSLTATQIAALAGNGIDVIDATDNVLSLSVAQYNALGAVALTGADVVTISDIGANLATLNFATLAAHGVDFLDASDNTLALTVAQYTSLGAVQLTAADVVTLADTGANIQALLPAAFASLAANGIDKIDASNNVLTLSVAQYQALGSVALTGSDTITLLDTGAHLETLDFTQLAANKIDVLDASDNVLTLTAAQFSALGTVSLKSSDTVTLLDSGADISALTPGQFASLAAKGIDILDAVDNAYSLTTAQVNGLGALLLAANDTITLSDTEANLEAETPAQLSNAIAVGIDIISSSGGTLNMSVAQVEAVLGTTAVFDTANTVTLLDTGAHIQALTATQIGQLAGIGVDKIDASNNALTLSLAQYEALGTVALTAADTVTIQNDNNGLSAMSVAEIQGLSAKGVDVLESTNGNFTFDTAQAHALVNQTGGGHVSLSASDTFYISDTAANIGALSLADIAALGAEGAGSVDLIASGTLTVNLAYYNAVVAAGVTIDAGDNTVLADTGAALHALSVAALGALAGNGIDSIDATDNVLTLRAGQLSALGSVALTAGDAVTLGDTETTIEALSAAALTGYATQGVDFFHATNTQTLNMNELQVAAVLASTAAFSASDTVTLFDAGTAIAALSAAQFGQLAAKGVDKIDASDNTLSLSTAQYLALGTVKLTGADVVTLADNSTHLTALTSAQIQGLHAGGIDTINSSNNAFTLTAADAHALVNQTGGGTVTISGTDTVTISDTGANISGLSVADLSALAGEGAGSIVLLANGAYSLSVAQYSAITSGSIALTASDTVALADMGSTLATYLTPTNIAALVNIDSIDATDNAISLSVAQLNALATASVALTPADVVTLADAAGTIQGFTATQFTNYAAQGVDLFHATGGTLTLNEIQGAAVLDSAAGFTASDSVTIADSAANLQSLSIAELDQLGPKNVDALQITGGGTLTLSVAGYQALFGNTVVTGTGTVTLSDTGPDLATLSVTQLAGLTGVGVDHIDATDNAISFSEAQTAALVGQSASVTFDATDTITVADLGANIALLTAANLTALAGMGAGHIVLDASDNVLTLTTAQYNAAVAGSIALTPADTVTLADLGANLSALTSTQLNALSANGIDAIHATDGAVTFTIAQLNALQSASVALTPSDTVTLSDSEANVEALTAGQITAFAAQGVDLFDDTGHVLNMNESQVAAVVNSSAGFTGSDNVSLVDTGADIQALTASQFALLAARGIDHIDASNNVLSLTAAQYSGLGATTLTLANTVTLSDSGAAISALSAAQFAQFAANGIDTIDATDNALTLSLAQFNGLGAVTLTQTDVITLADLGANLGALTPAQIGALAGEGIDRIDATDNVLSLSVAQFQALGSVLLTGADTVTLADQGATLDALTPTQIGALAGAGIDKLDATDNVMSLSVAQYQALHTVQLTASDNVTLFDTGADISALSAAQIGALAGHGIDTIDASNNAITFTLAKYHALGAVHLSLDDVVTVNGTANTDLIQGQAGGQILNGQGGDDVLFGQDGNDTLDGGLGNDTLNGGNGNDTVVYGDATSAVVVNLAAGTATGGAGSDLLTSIENAKGSAYADTLIGSSGSNVLSGGDGNDILIGGGGADQLTGGTGADHFVFQNASDSNYGAHDTITDFSHAQGDQIDVSAMGNFTFVTGFTHQADQIEAVNAGGGVYHVFGDINGDGTADFVIYVHSTTALVASDFIL